MRSASSSGRSTTAPSTPAARLEFLGSRPLLPGDRVELVVLPGARDSQVAAREALLAEADLFEHANRGRVPRDHRRLDAVQVEWPERSIDRLAHRLGRVPAPVVAFGDEVAKVGVLERPARDPAQLDAPDELVRLREEDAEVDEVLGRQQLRDPALLDLEREERVRAGRLPRIEERAVAHEQLEQRLRVRDLEFAHVDAQSAAFEVEL